MLCRNRSCPFHTLSRDAGPDCIVGDCVYRADFAEGEVLFMQGQPSASLYALVSGMVKICTHSPDGREQIVGMSTPANLLVGLQSVSDERYAYTAIAATPVEACRINHRALLARLRDGSEVAPRLVRAFNAQLAHSRALMEVLGRRGAAAKIAAFIVLMTPRSAHGNCEFSMPFSRVEMASLLGLSEETVCRSMAAMRRTGAIYAPRGHIEIRDWDQLHAIAEERTDERAVA